MNLMINTDALAFEFTASTFFRKEATEKWRKDRNLPAPGSNSGSELTLRTTRESIGLCSVLHFCKLLFDKTSLVAHQLPTLF